MLDTNCDPDPIDYPVPANDDAIRSIQFIVGQFASAIEEGRNKFNGIKEIVQKEEDKVEAEANEKVEVIEEVIVEETTVTSEVVEDPKPESKKSIEVVEKAEVIKEEINVDGSGDIKLGENDK